ncbi:universal stress protein [Thalassomonas viridans]|uniref:Universal stress protein n=1 Tax=Thalassomonas viridans TaxID=137584 RepID=A0AAE9Z8N1_9GAMM|nr:universal stress protein [Thalassomonas viridans]WDE08059.1 universal stress protein [Thalassomonas viridans]
MKINHILVIMDPTIEEQPALLKAIPLAKKCDAAIELFLVVHHSALAPSWLNREHPQEHVIAEYLQSKQRWLDDYLGLGIKENIAITSEVRWHKPLHREILKKITESSPDLVAISTHQHSAIEQLNFNANDWQFLKTCPVPLLLAKANTGTEYQNIMAAVDLKKPPNGEFYLDKEIIDTCVMLSEYLETSAHINHVYDPKGQELWQGNNLSLLGFNMPSYISPVPPSQLESYHRTEFYRLIEHYAFDDTNIHLDTGIPGNRLTRNVIKHKIDLLIAGVRCHSGFIGNTTGNIVDHVNCDILALKAENPGLH